MKTLCLVMIVRNEAKVLRRCLDSVRDVISHWAICDTGSTDGTQALVEEVLSGIPGMLHQADWLNFGHNRSHALALAKGKADYYLLIDADMTLEVSGEFRDHLSADSYLLRQRGDCEFWVDRIVSAQHDWRYLGATHEFIQSDTARTRAKLDEASIIHHEDGGARADKYERDLVLLKQELASDPENARSVFYLAQTYRDLGNLAQSMEWYGRRAQMGGWEEETWYALYQVARAQHRLGMVWPFVLNSYLTAYQFRPSRAEPLYYVARFYRENQEYHLGYFFSRAAIELSYPDDILFLERGIYRWELPLEYAACCEALGKQDEALRVRKAVAADPDVPARWREAAADSGVCGEGRPLCH